MKKNNIKPLVMSALTALAMGAVGTVGTFALFTDKAETTVNIEAGKVDVSTGVTIQKAYSLNAQDATTVTSGTEASYVNGGSASVDGSIVEIKKWTPGDGIKLRTSPVNESNVNILSRIKISLVGDLASALEIRVRSAGASDTKDTNVIYGRIGAGQLVSDWVSLAYSETPNNPTAYDIDIVFPDHDNGEIKFGADNKDNQYMESTATVVIAYEAVQGNADVGANLLERINTTLATESIRDKGYNKTMYDAIADIAEANLADEAAVKTAGYVWSPETDQFYDFSSAPADAYKYFKIADNYTQAGDYSIYASASWGVSAVTLEGIGFDAGNTTNVTSVSYTGVTDPRCNIIRTNSFGTDVTIYAPQDSIDHFGNANVLDIIDINHHSYHEYGSVLFMQVAKGRVALEESSSVEQIHISTQVTSVDTNTGEKTKTADVFDNIVIAVDESTSIPKLSRDPVTNIGSSGTLVVEIQNNVEEDKASSDYVWLFQQGLKEQIRVTSDAEVTTEELAEAPKSTELSEGNTKSAAYDIANNLRDGSQATAAMIENGEVEATDIVETGLTEVQIDDAIINNVSEDICAVNRFTFKKYSDVELAFAELKNHQRLDLINDCVIDSRTILYYYYADDPYFAPGFRVDINIDAGVTLTFKDQGELIADVTSSSCRLVFGGTGTIKIETSIPAFKSSYNYWNNNLQLNEVIEANDITVNGGIFSDMKVLFNSGKYNTAIVGHVNAQYSKVYGGYFTEDISPICNKAILESDLDGYNYKVNPDAPGEVLYTVIPNNPRHETWECTSDIDFAWARAAYYEEGFTVKFHQDYSANSSIPFSCWGTAQGGYSNIVLDLQGHALNINIGLLPNAQQPQYVFDLLGDHVTIKNAVVNITKDSVMSLAPAAQDSSVFKFENCSFVEHGEYSGAFIQELADHCPLPNAEPKYLGNGEGYFTFVAEIPENCPIKLIRNGVELAYVGENAVHTVFGMLAHLDEIYMNCVTDEIITLPVGYTITVTLASGISEMPTIVKPAEADELIVVDLSENSKSYTSKLWNDATVYDSQNNQVAVVKNLANAFSTYATSKNYTIKLERDLELKTTLNLVNKAFSGLTFDLNGHELWSDSVSLMDIQVSGASGNNIHITDSSVGKTGKMTSNNAQKPTIRFQGRSGGYIWSGTNNMTNKRVYLDDGTIQNTAGGYALQFYSSGTSSDGTCLNTVYVYCDVLTTGAVTCRASSVSANVSVYDHMYFQAGSRFNALSNYYWYRADHALSTKGKSFEKYECGVNTNFSSWDLRIVQVEFLGQQYDFIEVYEM